MKVTIEYLRNKFNEYNAQYFNNEIPMVSFLIIRSKTPLGYYRNRTRTIAITSYYSDIAEHDVEEILIHEMVHAWQHATGHCDTGKNHHHGWRFYQKAEEINIKSNHYFHISRLTSLSPETKEGGRVRISNSNPFILGRKSGDTTCYIGKVTEKALATFPKWLVPRYYETLEFFYVDDTIAPMFADYAVSRSRFNYKTMKEEDFQAKVKPHIKPIQVLSACR